MSVTKMKIEDMFQRKTPLEHILARPDTYIGTVQPVTQNMWVLDKNEKMINKKLTFVPGLLKIFDEILVNAADNKHKSESKMDLIKIDIDEENNYISIWNNGTGVPVVMHKTENMLVPTLLFGHLLTSSNYSDEDKKVTGGRNGYGAKLTNIFSKKFIVETASAEFGKQFKQQWLQNMTVQEEPEVSDFEGPGYTKITFHPDLSRFKMTVLEKDVVEIMKRRAYDIAGCTGISVELNGKPLPVKNFKEYVEMYTSNRETEQQKVAYENVGERWQVAATLSDSGFKKISFVNAIATYKGGQHVDYVTDQITKKVADAVNNSNKGGKELKPFQVKNYLWVFINSLIENPTFDSQTKENMTLQINSFGSECQLTEMFFHQVLKCGITETLTNWIKLKAQSELHKKSSGKKVVKLRGLPKLDDANDAGTDNSLDCTLILTEGDSAKSLAVSGFGILSRDKYGVFPLKGKLLNVREATHEQILGNEEINNLVKIIGLDYSKKYEEEKELKSLRYGRVMIMTDQDLDGSHIKGLLINFVHVNWPKLIQYDFLEQFITPIIKVSKSNIKKNIYSDQEFQMWKNETEDSDKYKVKYYKGLGTSTSKEAKEYFSDMQRHRIKFHYTGIKDDLAIQLAFSSTKIEERKKWIQTEMDKSPSEISDLYAAGKTSITFSDFINSDLVHYSTMDNHRSIPSVIDGLKPSQRKVLHTLLKRNDAGDLKVSQLVGAIVETAAYHHGEQALCGTIVNLAQDFVGTNNINLLLPIGQFGTRLQGGRDAANSRYICTKLSPIAKFLFSSLDSPLLKYLSEDNQKIEPEYFVPIIPMVLVNGPEGIGTGWSTKVPNFRPTDIINYILSKLNGETAGHKIKPWYRYFNGSIIEKDEKHFVSRGNLKVLADNTIEINELPIKMWTQSYKEYLEEMVHEKKIDDYIESHTDTSVKFNISLTPKQLTEAQNEGLYSLFKLESKIAMTNMVLFNSKGKIQKYENVEQVLDEFIDIRLQLYKHRKEHMISAIEAETIKCRNQARFIEEVTDNKIKIFNTKRAELIHTLQEKRYNPDPVKAYKVSQKSAEERTQHDEYNYLLGMPLENLTLEIKEELLKKTNKKEHELMMLREKNPATLWQEELNKLVIELSKIEENEDNTYFPMKEKRHRQSESTKTKKKKLDSQKQ